MSPRLIQKLPALLGLASVMALSACAGSGDLIGHADPHPLPVLPSEQYGMTAETQTSVLNFRVEPSLSDNQRRALDGLAARAAWTAGNPIDVQIVTAGDPASINVGRAMAAYLVAHDIDEKGLSLHSDQRQANDIVTVNIVTYRAKALNCNQSWENLAATATNSAYVNFGCAVTANLAAQIADPRDLDHPHPADPADAGRKSDILGKYRDGKVTSAELDDNAKGNISDAIK